MARPSKNQYLASKVMTTDFVRAYQGFFLDGASVALFSEYVLCEMECLRSNEQRDNAGLGMVTSLGYAVVISFCHFASDIFPKSQNKEKDKWEREGGKERKRKEKEKKIGRKQWRKEEEKGKRSKQIRAFACSFL